MRMAGNAVALPVGHFVMSAVEKALGGLKPSRFGMPMGFFQITPHGFHDEGTVWSINHAPTLEANNLDAIIEPDVQESLSAQAAAGLLYRTIRSGKPMPVGLFDVLEKLSRDRTGKTHGSRSDSFAMLDREVDLPAYRRRLEREG